MDEKAAIEEAVRSRLSLHRALKHIHTGPHMIMQLLGLRHLFEEAERQWHNIEHCASLLSRNLAQCATFVLNDTESDTVIGSHESYPSNIAHASETVTPEGFVYFSKPIPDPTKREPYYPVRAISWSVTPPEEALFPVYHVGDRDEEHTLTLVAYADSKHIMDGLSVVSGTPIYPVAYVVWAIGVEGGGKLHKEPRPDLRDERECYIKILLAFWALLHSEVLTQEEPVERSKKTKDRLKHARKKDPRLNTAITVVRYRKRKPSGRKSNKSSNSRRKISVQYWRRPFWKWVYYPSLEDNRIRRIEPFLSGPEDAPIVGHERIFQPPKPAGPKPVHEKKKE